MRHWAALLAVLLVACGGRSFSGAAADGGGSTRTETDGGAAVVEQIASPAESAAAQVEEGTADPADLSAPLAAAVLEPVTLDAGAPKQPPEAEAAAPPARPPDAGHGPGVLEASAPEPPHAPAGEEYFEGLVERGYSLDACNGLIQSVALCCSEGGTSFECDRDGCWCPGTQRKFAKASALCLVSPAVPLSWECVP